MQDIQQNQVLSAIDTIFQKGHKSKFSESFQKSVTKETEIVKDYLGISEARQAMFWSMLFSMCIQSNSSIDLDMFSNYLNTTILRVLLFQKDFETLIKSKLLLRQKSSRRRRGEESLPFLNLSMPMPMVYSVVNNDPLPKQQKSNLTIYELLDEVYSIFYQRDEGFIDHDEFTSDIENLISENKSNPTVRALSGRALEREDNQLMSRL